jgi:hypothetical protein
MCMVHHLKHQYIVAENALTYTIFLNYIQEID